MFYGLYTTASWPAEIPKGRIIAVKERHCTLIFLGKKPYEHQTDLPLPPFKTAPTGYFSRPLFLPERSPRVAAWKMEWFTPGIVEYQHMLTQFFEQKGFSFEKREWLPHLTLARNPEDREAWEGYFKPLPFITPSFRLYESLGNSTYATRWEQEFHPPFKELPHTADLAFLVFGEDIRALYFNALSALASTFPSLLLYLNNPPPLETHDDVVIALNKLVEAADREIGCPFKAVSYSGEIRENGSLLEWEMIVDV